MITVFVPAALDTNRTEGEGWAILRGKYNPPEVVAFCWSHENAEAIYVALGKQEGGGVWMSPALLQESSR